MEIKGLSPEGRITEFRSLLTKYDLDGYVVPHNDAHDV